MARSEQELLLPAVCVRSVLAADTLITADAGYHSEANLAALAEMRCDALIPDNGMRSRDERLDARRTAVCALQVRSSMAKGASARSTDLTLHPCLGLGLEPHGGLKKWEFTRGRNVHADVKGRLVSFSLDPADVHTDSWR